MHLANILSIIFLAISVSAAPLSKRFYRPSSEVFSIIAYHEGSVFQYNLLKWNGKDLVLNADEQAFFGRVRASQGYVLNMPGSEKGINATQGSSNNINVHVDPNTYKLSTTNGSANATHGFAIENQVLTYKNSSTFLACPDFSYRGEYHVYWDNHNKTRCPGNFFGYKVSLIVQTDASTTYTPESNVNNYSFNSSSKRDAVEEEHKKKFYFF